MLAEDKPQFGKLYRNIAWPDAIYLAVKPDTTALGKGRTIEFVLLLAHRGEPAQICQGFLQDDGRWIEPSQWSDLEIDLTAVLYNAQQLVRAGRS